MNATCECSRKVKRLALRNGAGWVVPGIFLVLLPKCPLCLAAAFSVTFGIGLSAAAAGVIHGCAIILCLLAMFTFAMRQLSPWFQRQHFAANPKSPPGNTIKL